ncbi:MAG: hypothetical protein ACRERC_13470 [Candidatus Binatia bacterium]
MTFAVLTAAELRLVDVLLARGVFPHPPVSVFRSDIAAMAPADTTRPAFPHLRARLPQIMAIARPVGGVLAQGSIAELVRLWALPPDRDPTAD